MSRSDLMRSKGVHLKLDKATHINFKTRLLHHDLTMQDALEEFAKQVGAGYPSAIRILERLAMNKVKAELASVGLTRPGTRHRPKKLDELDSETLYDLINEGEHTHDDEPLPHSDGDHSEVT